MKKIGSSLVFAIGACLALTAPQAVVAQVPAALPDKESVAVGEATDADGTYVVSTINKRITIDRGRAYVVDPWNTALIFTVKKGMVTLQNFRQTGPDTFEADDLPMMGKVVFNRQPNGTLQGVVQGVMGEAKYALVPAELAEVPSDDMPIGAPPTPEVALDRIYRVHVSGSRCDGTQMLRGGFGGTFKLSIVDPVGVSTESRWRNFAVDCKDDGNRSQNYAFYENGPGALTITVPADGAPADRLRLITRNRKNWNFTDYSPEIEELLAAINFSSQLSVGQSLDNQITVKSGKTTLIATVTVNRVQ